MIGLNGGPHGSCRWEGTILPCRGHTAAIAYLHTQLRISQPAL